jgi:hypothetical protein
MSEHRQPVRLVAETADTVTLRRADFETLLDELEDAEDRIAVLESGIDELKDDGAGYLTPLTVEEVDRVTGRRKAGQALAGQAWDDTARPGGVGRHQPEPGRRDRDWLEDRQHRHTPETRRSPQGPTRKHRTRIATRRAGCRYNPGRGIRHDPGNSAEPRQSGS